MAITASLGYTSDMSIVVDKAATFGNAITVEATGSINDIDCQFVLNGSGFFTSNYMKVLWPGCEFDYYYYINKRESMSGNRTLLICELDVLKTFARIIGESPAVIARTSNPAYVNFFVRDNKVPIVSTTQISTKNFGGAILPEQAQEYIYVGIWQTSKAIGGAQT